MAGRSDEPSQVENEGFLHAMDTPRTADACRGGRTIYTQLHQDRFVSAVGHVCCGAVWVRGAWKELEGKG